MRKLRSKEIEILGFLEQNAGVSVSKVSKRVGAKQSTVRYHLEKLYAAGLIRVVPEIDFSMLEREQYRLLLSLKEDYDINTPDLLSMLLKETLFFRLQNVSGEYQIVLDLLLPNHGAREKLYKLLDECLAGKLKNKLCHKVVRSYFLGREYLLGVRKQNDKNEFKQDSSESMILSQRDVDVLKALLNVSYRSRSHLARVLSVPASSLEYRIARLERNKIIGRWMTEVKSSKLGCLAYEQYLNISFFSSGAITSLIDILWSLPHVVAISLLEGAFDLSVRIEVHRSEDLLVVQRKITKQLHRMIVRSSLLHVLSESDSYDLTLDQNSDRAVGELRIAA